MSFELRRLTGKPLGEVKKLESIQRSCRYVPSTASRGDTEIGGARS